MKQITLISKIITPFILCISCAPAPEAPITEVVVAPAPATAVIVIELCSSVAPSVAFPAKAYCIANQAMALFWTGDAAELRSLEGPYYKSNTGLPCSFSIKHCSREEIKEDNPWLR